MFFTIILPADLQSGQNSIPLNSLTLPLSLSKELQTSIESAIAENLDIGTIDLMKIGAVAIAKNIADVIRTPIYGLALTILSAVGLILGLIRSEKIYSVRQRYGDLELSLCWGDKRNRFMVAPCFQSLSHIHSIEQEWGKISQRKISTNYSLANQTEGVSNLARIIVHYHVENQEFISQILLSLKDECCGAGVE